VSESDQLAAQLLEQLGASGRTLAVAESLSGGLLAATLVSVPGASKVFRGAVVAYATDVKSRVLGVPPALLESNTAVDPEVASAMAAGVMKTIGADVAIATTGVAGPDPVGDQPVGKVFIAVVERATGVEIVRGLNLEGDRQSIRQQSVDVALSILAEVLATDADS
jgi:nicotinamide-nucleotide amidase